jgi:hypothetical protein
MVPGVWRVDTSLIGCVPAAGCVCELILCFCIWAANASLTGCWTVAEFTFVDLMYPGSQQQAHWESEAAVEKAGAQVGGLMLMWCVCAASNIPGWFCTRVHVGDCTKHDTN